MQEVEGMMPVNLSSNFVILSIALSLAATLGCAATTGGDTQVGKQVTGDPGSSSTLTFADVEVDGVGTAEGGTASVIVQDNAIDSTRGDSDDGTGGFVFFKSTVNVGSNNIADGESLFFVWTLPANAVAIAEENYPTSGVHVCESGANTIVTYEVQSTTLRCGEYCKVEKGIENAHLNEDTSGITLEVTTTDPGAC